MKIKDKRQISYIDSRLFGAGETLGAAIYDYVSCTKGFYDNIVICCIGTDRATGDSLGPIVGHMLSTNESHRDIGISIYGTLEKPLHAKNICETMSEISHTFENPLIIAVDACLGRSEHIGYLTIGRGSVNPGAGLNKKLPEIGEIFITGVVNHFSGAMDFVVLQNTRLHTVMKMAEVISSGLQIGLDALGNLYKPSLSERRYS